ncbi:alpha/beta hydrolase-fold protein [Clostridium sp. HBUAS56010]|uniref:alpha/beta hydrolase n=1 Tax=Clostridium sp. HBUAS56010 TaxID=2571127 RepID=UPI0011775240|nr:alpha/beta hydrolase-fold protein [Clostridium sp. HBUAS56010]
MNSKNTEKEPSIMETQWEDHKLYLYLPRSWDKNREQKYPVVLVQDGDQAYKALSPVISELETLWQKGIGREFIMVMICPVDRLSEYTPWRAPAMSSRFPDFSGEGSQYLESLRNRLLPWLCETYQADIHNSSMLGYSLGGLIGIYALTIQNCWRHVAGICSSFWYSNWSEYLENSSLSKETRSIYLHYGEGEGKGKSGPMKKAKEYAEQTAQFLESKFPGKVTVTKDHGGHHTFADQRFKNGLLWLNKEIGDDPS